MWDRLRRMVTAAGRRRQGGRRGVDLPPTTSDAWNPSGWWWCFDHQRAENPPDVPGNRRLGPYDSASDAEHWRDRLDRRNQEWEDADRRWAGDD